MGLFSDLFGSSSHTQTTQSTSNVTNTQLAGGPLTGNVNYGGGTQVINETSAPAFQMATDIGTSAIALGAGEAKLGSDVAIAGLNHAYDAYTSSLALVGSVNRDSLNNDYALASGAIDANTTFAGKAVDSINRFGQFALNSNAAITGDALSNEADAFSQSLNSANSANAAALSGVEQIAAQVSQSSQQTTDQTVKQIILYLVLGVVAYALLRKA